MPWAFVLPRTREEVVAIGRSIAKTIFLSAGNITHTPHYGHLIALGVLAAAETRNAAPHHIANAMAYRDEIAEHRRFLTFCGGAAIIGQRMQPDPTDRVSVKTGARDRQGHGRARPARHAHEPGLCRGGLCRRADRAADRRAPGRVYRAGRRARGHDAVPQGRGARRRTRSWRRCRAAMTSSTGRCGSTTCSSRGSGCSPSIPTPEAIPRWLRWHHLYGWLAKAEFTLGLALALTDAMGLKEHDATVEYLVDLIAEVQTVRSCLAAAEHDPEFTPTGYCVPNHAHLAAGGISLFKARQRISEILRIIPGSSLVVAPGDSDLAIPELAQGLEETFGGGGYTARQRSALLQLAWDHVSSALDGRESAFELHASGGMPGWRAWLRRSFRDYNQLANAVLTAIDLPMPAIDVGSIPALARSAAADGPLAAAWCR